MKNQFEISIWAGDAIRGDGREKDDLGVFSAPIFTTRGVISREILYFSEFCA